MKASRFTDTQKAFILKQGVEGYLVAELCRKAGISEATYFNGKKKYDGLLPVRCGYAGFWEPVLTRCFPTVLISGKYGRNETSEVLETDFGSGAVSAVPTALLNRLKTRGILGFIDCDGGFASG